MRNDYTQVFTHCKGAPIFSAALTLSHTTHWHLTKALFMFSPSFKSTVPSGERVVFIIAYVLHAVSITTNKSQQGQTGNLISQLAFNPTFLFLSDV